MRKVWLVSCCAVAIGCGSPGTGGGGGGAGGGSGTGDDMAGTTTPAQPGPVRLGNPSLRAVGAGEFDLVFDFVDDAWQANRVDSLDRVLLSWGSGDQTSLEVRCVEMPWTVAQQTVSAVAIDLFYDAVHGTSALFVPCGSGARTQAGTGVQAAAPGGIVHVKLEGTLTDRTLFAATADVPVM